MFNFAKRNLKLYFRNKSGVFFSMLGVFIIIGLYLVFLGDTWKNNFEGLPDTDILMNRWLISGILSVSSVTTTMGAFGIMVEDRARKNSKDFYSSPIKRSQIAGGYILSAFTTGLLMTVLTFLLGEIYILASGGTLLPFLTMIKVFGIMLITVLCSSSMVLFMVSFFRSVSTFSTASTIMGTLIGFLTGIYVPLGSLPKSVGWVIKLFPVSHGAALLRQVMMEETIAASFGGAPENIVLEFKRYMGVIFEYGSHTVDYKIHILFLLSVTAVFYGFSILNILKKNK